MDEKIAISAVNLSKTFTLHNLGTKLYALKGVSFSLPFGKCLAISGPSGAGKSTLLRCLYGNYRASSGSILIAHGREKAGIGKAGNGASGNGASVDENSKEDFLDLTKASEREILNLRKESLSYVSQFLRVIPRVSALEITAGPLLEKGADRNLALTLAEECLGKLNIPQRLFPLPPLTFSGGERQRVNIARGLIKEAPVILLDEPTASLDQKNREIAAELFLEAKRRGAAIVGIFHDEEIRDKVADIVLELKPPEKSL
jgi:alpha-D-ribose 1-methylphosphonate 5-triphosphate synthase subunit PhnL